VRARIEAVLDYAKARNYRDGDNPARWKGHLETLLAEAAGYPRPGPQTWCFYLCQRAQAAAGLSVGIFLTSSSRSIPSIVSLPPPFSVACNDLSPFHETQEDALLPSAAPVFFSELQITV